MDPVVDLLVDPPAHIWVDLLVRRQVRRQGNRRVNRRVNRQVHRKVHKVDRKVALSRHSNNYQTQA